MPCACALQRGCLGLPSSWLLPLPASVVVSLSLSAKAVRGGRGERADWLERKLLPCLAGIRRQSREGSRARARPPGTERPIGCGARVGSCAVQRWRRRGGALLRQRCRRGSLSPGLSEVSEPASLPPAAPSSIARGAGGLRPYGGHPSPEEPGHREGEPGDRCKQRVEPPYRAACCRSCCCPRSVLCGRPFSARLFRGL